MSDKLTAFKNFLQFWKENPFKVATLFVAIVCVALSALGVVGLVIWFFVIHPDLLLKTLAL